MEQQQINWPHLHKQPSSDTKNRAFSHLQIRSKAFPSKKQHRYDFSRIPQHQEMFTSSPNTFKQNKIESTKLHLKVQLERTNSVRSNQSAKANIIRQQIKTARPIREWKHEKTQRKNTASVKPIEIYNFLRDPHHSPNHFRQTDIFRPEPQNNKSLIQKLLKVNCKLITTTNHQNRPHISSQLTHHCSPKQLRLNYPEEQQSPAQPTSCSDHTKGWLLLKQNLHKNIFQSNKEQQTQFQRLLMKKKLQFSQNSKQYNNQQIYSKIRQQYRHEENDPEETGLSLMNSNRKRKDRTQILNKKREEIKSMFTFRAWKNKQLQQEMKKEQEQKIKGW